MQGVVIAILCIFCVRFMLLNGIHSQLDEDAHGSRNRRFYQFSNSRFKKCDLMLTGNNMTYYIGAGSRLFEIYSCANLPQV